MNISWFTVIGLAAATCATTGFIMQAIKSIKIKKTEDISLLMYIIFIIGLCLWLIYGIFNKDLHNYTHKLRVIKRIF